MRARKKKNNTEGFSFSMEKVPMLIPKEDKSKT
jgi:hypothetical protein